MGTTRRRILAVGLLVVVALLAVAGGQAMANGRRHGDYRGDRMKTTLKLSAEPSRVATVGEPIVLTGSLSTETTESAGDDDAESSVYDIESYEDTPTCDDPDECEETTPVAGVQVGVFKSFDRGHTWSHVETVTTGADGTFTLSQAIDAPTWFGAWFPGDDVYAPACSHAIRVRISTGVYRFRHRRSGAYLWTASEAEKNGIVRSMSKTWSLEGVAYEVDSANPSNSATLYRFRNLEGGHYLYTASEAEKTSILKNMGKTWVLEGAAYSVSNDPSGAPVWRFRNLVDGTYLLTGSASEKTDIERNMKNTWQMEGVSFHIAP